VVGEGGYAQHAGGAEAQVAAAAGEVEDELGLVAAVDAEGGVAAVERAVEELGAVFDDEVRAVGPVAQRTLDVGFEIGEQLLRHGLGESGNRTEKQIER